MANRDTPHGFRFAYTIHGGPPKISYYRCKDGVYNGDLVYWDSSGILPRTTGDTIDTDFMIGVAAAYNASGQSGTIPVYDDIAGTVFSIQIDSSDLDFGSSDFLDTYSTTWVSGSTITGISAMEIDGADTPGMCRYVGLVATPDNSTADQHQEIYVNIIPTISYSLMGAATTPA